MPFTTAGGLGYSVEIISWNEMTPLTVLTIIASVVPMVVRLDRFSFTDQNDSTGLELQFERSVEFLPFKLLEKVFMNDGVDSIVFNRDRKSRICDAFYRMHVVCQQKLT